MLAKLISRAFRFVKSVDTSKSRSSDNPLCLLVLLAAQSVLWGCAADPPTIATEGTTDNEDHSLGLADCDPIDPGLADADAEALFDYPHVPAFEFFLPAEEWEKLQENARDEEYVAAELCFEGQFVGTVGLRFKGYYGSLYNCFNEQDEMICPRLSMKAKFSEYDTEQRLFGLKRLNFHAYRYDDSRMKERLTYDLFRSMGIVTPRASWAVVSVNHELQGLYGMVEQVDGRFTADRWPNSPNGNLYKEVWPTFASPGDVLEGLKTNEEDANIAAYSAFVEALEAAEDDEVLGVLDDYIGLDYLARYMAVDDATANYDGVTYLWTDGTAINNHNFYFYEEAPDQFTLIPWDVESTFWINPEHAAPHWTEIPDDCSKTYPYWDGLAKAPGCDRIFRALATDLSAWRAAGREFLDGPFTVAAMRETIDRYQSYMGDEARADPTKTMYDTFDGTVGGLRNVISEMRDRFERLIAGSTDESQ